VKKIIGIVGLIGSGKDTIADHLTDTHYWTRMSFAARLKDIVSLVFGWDRDLLDGRTAKSRHWREQVDPWWSEKLGIENLTPRWVLQYWGTEVCRTGFHQDIWIRSLERQISMSPDNIVITDARFANEIKLIGELGGKIIRVKRGPDPVWFRAAEIVNTWDKYSVVWSDSNRLLKEMNVHASESSWAGLPVDYIVENNGTIDELNQRINEIVNQM